MGAYLAGYWGFTRWKHTNDLIMINGRLKTEWFSAKIEEQNVLNHINIVAFNGKSDTVVDPQSQSKCIEYCKNNNLNAEFHELDGGHELTNEHVNKIKNWLITLGYRNVEN
jgi:predicted esterase